MDILTDKLIAHCGLVAPDAPENSLRAFARALDAGFAIECDVQVTRAGEVVVFHDNSLTRLCQRSETVDELTHRTRVLSHLSATDQVIPTLAEVLEVAGARGGVFVDLKPHASLRVLSRRDALKRVSAVAEVLRAYPGPVGVMSWDPRQLRWLRDNAPSVLRVQSGGVGGALLLLPGMAAVLDGLHLNWLSTPHAVSYNAGLLPRKSVEAARRSGVKVLGWVVRDEESLRRTLLHADNALFEGFTPVAPSPRELERAGAAPGRARAVVEGLRAGRSHRGGGAQLAAALVPAAAGALLRSEVPRRLAPWVVPLAAAATSVLLPRNWWAAGAGGAVGSSSFKEASAALIGAVLGSSSRAAAQARGAGGR